MRTTNVIFKYMYRDASNYKLHGEAIFTNHTLLPLEEIEKQIRAFLSDGEYFIADRSTSRNAFSMCCTMTIIPGMSSKASKRPA